MREKRKRRRIFLLKLVVLALIIYIVIAVFFQVVGSNIRNIVIVDNQYLTDQEIIDQAGLTDYPSFFESPSFVIRNRLLKDDLIKEVKVRKGWFNKVTITVTENRPLFMRNELIVLQDGTEIPSRATISAPILVNHVPDAIFSDLLIQMGNLRNNVLRKISEIEYSPNDIDETRFLLHMTDGNLVYINISTFNKLNRYDSILPTLEGKKGILYLDFGDHFEVRE